MKRILVTNEFCSGSKELVNKNRTQVVNDLRSVLIMLANDWDIPKKYHNHRLTNSDFMELHVAGDVLLLYKQEADKDTLVVTLKLTNLTDHKKLSKDANRSDYIYKEVPTQELHNITSSNRVFSALQEVELNDALESISDYASGYLNNGYVILDEYFVEDEELHCYYSYHTYETDEGVDTIDFVIDLNLFSIDIITNNLVDTFAQTVAAEFNKVDIEGGII